MIYYGFDVESRRCMFSANSLPAHQPGLVILTDSEELPISDIELGMDSEGDFYIRTLQVPPEKALAEAKAKKEQMLLDGNARLAILCTVNKTRNDPLIAAKIAEWEAWIAEVYFIDVGDTSVRWPPMPELI